MKSTFKCKTYGIAIAGILALGLAGCSGIKTEAKYPENRDSRQDDADIYGDQAGVFGGGGLFSKKKRADSGENSIGVNSFLWRATLDTVSFMPLASADPFGGVIITDWYSDPATPNQRVKVNAFVLGRELKADGVRVRTFRQELKGGTWRDATVAEETASKLEDTILTRARELRIAHLAN